MNLGMITARPDRFEDLLVLAASWLLAGALCWLCVLLLAVLVEALSAGRWQPARWTGAPLAWRRALLAVVVGTLAVLGVAPAQADSAGRAPTGTAIEGLPLPARPSGGLPPAAEVAEHVVVAPGDSLWAIARQVEPATDDAGLAALVQRIHQLNRAVIGADPDQIHPGQRLLLPADRPTQPDPSHPEEPR